jgi:hypothetical protein
MTLSPLPPRADLLSSRLYQAALTYTQRWLFRINGILFLIMLTAIGCFAPLSDSSRSIWANIAIIQICLASASVTIHLKQQLEDWRSWLTPGFRLPHLAVAGIVVILLNLGAPLLLAAPLQTEVSTLSSAALAFSTLLAWTIYDPLLVFLFVAVGLTLLLRRFRENQEFMETSFQFQWSVCLGSAAFIALLWACLSRLNGESVQRQNRPFLALHPGAIADPGTGAVGPITNLARESHQWIAAGVNAMKAARFRSTFQPLTGTWARILHRRYVTAEGTLPLAAGALSSLVMLTIVSPFKFFLHGEEPEVGGVILGICSIVLPIIFAGVVWPRRWPNLALESLLPASRQAFVYEMGVALAIDLSILWLSTTAVSLAGGAVLFPHAFKTFAPNITGAVVLSALTQPAIFALIVWTMPLRKGWVSLGLLLLLMWGSMIVISWNARDGATIKNLVAWAVALLLPSLLLTFHAYRRWCQTPLG